MEIISNNKIHFTNFMRNSHSASHIFHNILPCFLHPPCASAETGRADVRTRRQSLQTQCANGECVARYAQCSGMAQKKTGPMTEYHQAGVDMKRRTSSVPVQDIFLLSAAGYSLRSIFTMPPLASLNTTLTVEFLLNILPVSISVVPNWAIITSLSSMVPFLV